MVVVIMVMSGAVEEHMLIGSRLQQPCSREQRMPWPQAGGQGEALMLAGTCLLSRIVGVADGVSRTALTTTATALSTDDATMVASAAGR